MTLRGHTGPREHADHVHDDENLFGILEDLHEMIFRYQVRLRLEALLDTNKGNSWLNERRLSIKSPNG